MTVMQRQILKTLAFFDTLDQAVTSRELFANLYWEAEGVPAKESFDAALQELVSQRQIRQSEGFYLLADREDALAAKRQSAVLRSHALLGSARRWMRILSLWPGVEAIAVCNTVAFENAGRDSDIDLLVLTKPGWLWQTRFVLTAFLQVLGKRPKPGHEYGTFCLSFFRDADALDLADIAYPDDTYLDYWIRSLHPIYDPNRKIVELISCSRHLCKMDDSTQIIPTPDYVDGRLHQGVKWTLSHAFQPLRDKIEGWTKSWQEQRWPGEIRQALQSESTDVVINEKMLKFHTNDRRKFYQNAFAERCRALLSE